MTPDLPPDLSLLQPPGPQTRLLLVDDQPINIRVLQQIFSSQYACFAATGGVQALEFCRRTPPDLVLLDIVMPDMDGYAVCKALKADPATRDIPVVFITAHTDALEESQALELGAVDFISKPVNPAVVRARVKTHLTLKYQSDLLRQLVFRDGLTGAFNRRYFDQQLTTEVARSVRSQLPLALVMIDVDFFKRFNDHYGHQAGDDCLRQVVQLLQQGLRRPADLVARYGGEEFACILPETSFEDAMAIARELEDSVRAKAISHAASDVAGVVTISLGVAERLPDTSADPQALLALADAQLYQAKHSGRGRVCGQLLPPG
ncbi:MAG: diguanylate cyclase [Rhodoferax sp.]|nr:diguanylate cyclase [Rhodoferax sp.]NCP55230.1 diguanylate cyclase [Rhodoferax sp.]OIP19830.1 MAG: diguanylate cyclase response regulator [Comamonadaceae bacterium CG2_30_60_41]PIW10756.1 MAG: diguanylate cyclase response regulator [Comamonadaceae bacterium CG17_big_fil_post_rev_8_21_14_2_50_60_13]PJC19666.1 MAG: diguanylate cyclase response regulator [Comamonadaceae bacterium CG_4_9_14_0_8_um_filter_60_18]